MIFVALILVIVIAISAMSETHAIGLLLFMFVAHGFLVEVFGPAAIHLPLYSSLVVVITTLGRRKWRGISANSWLLVSALAAAMGLAALTGVDQANSVSDLGKYLKGIALAIFVAGVIRRDEQIKTLTVYCVVAVFLGACIAILQHFSGAYTIDVSNVQRAGGLSGDPNDTSMLLLVGIPLALYWAANSKNFYAKVGAASVFVLAMGAIALTQSRGGAIALALILLLLYFRRPSIKAFSIGAIFLSLAFIFTSAEYWERIGTLKTIGDTEYGSLDLRYNYLSTGIDLILENPMTGVGAGNFGNAFYAATAGYDDTDAVAHNMYLEFLVENGIPAGLLFMAVLGIAYIGAIKYDNVGINDKSSYSLSFCVSSSLLAVMVSGLFLSIGKSAVLWYLVGICLAFGPLSRLSSAEIKARRKRVQFENGPPAESRT